jgi:hypothetical protein
MSILELAIYGEGLVINDGMTATGYIHYALDKTNYTVVFWAEPDLMENTLK